MSRKVSRSQMKSVLPNFLVGIGLQPKSIVSYNNLRHDDGLNLSVPACFGSPDSCTNGSGRCHFLSSPADMIAPTKAFE